MIGETVAFFVFTWGLFGWEMYFRERSRSRDYVTDLSQVIYDYDLDRDDLRRSLGHDEIEERLNSE